MKNFKESTPCTHGKVVLQDGKVHGLRDVASNPRLSTYWIQAWASSFTSQFPRLSNGVTDTLGG